MIGELIEPKIRLTRFLHPKDKIIKVDCVGKKVDSVIVNNTPIYFKISWYHGYRGVRLIYPEKVDTLSKPFSITNLLSKIGLTQNEMKKENCVTFNMHKFETIVLDRDETLEYLDKIFDINKYVSVFANKPKYIEAINSGYDIQFGASAISSKKFLSHQDYITNSVKTEFVFPNTKECLNYAYALITELLTIPTVFHVNLRTIYYCYYNNCEFLVIIVNSEGGVYYDDFGIPISEVEGYMKVAYGIEVNNASKKEHDRIANNTKLINDDIKTFISKKHVSEKEIKNKAHELHVKFNVSADAVRVRINSRLEKRKKH